jgi:hypothetical protein
MAGAETWHRILIVVIVSSLFRHDLDTARGRVHPAWQRPRSPFERTEPMSDRTAQAIALRDHVMRLMEGNSKVVTLGQAKVHTWKRGRFLATLNTPFNPLHEREATAPGYVQVIAGGVVEPGSML